jgi:hypothetical protein
MMKRAVFWAIVFNLLMFFAVMLATASFMFQGCSDDTRVWNPTTPEGAAQWHLCQYIVINVKSTCNQRHFDLPTPPRNQDEDLLGFITDTYLSFDGPRWLFCYAMGERGHVTWRPSGAPVI